MPSNVRLRRRLAAIMALGAAVLLTGCATAGERLAAEQASSAPTTTQPTASAVRVAVSPGDGAVAVAPDQPVVVTAAGGDLTNVRLTGPDGDVTGQLDPNRATWRSTGRLRVAASYTVSAEATDPNGLAQTTTTSFTTLTPERTFGIRNAPLSGETVGVGMPIVLYFTAPIADRAAVESRLTVTTQPAVEGAWSWINDEELHWRPRDLWPVGTQVSVAMDMNGVRAGDNLWGDTSRTEATCAAAAEPVPEVCPMRFSISDHAIESVVDLATHDMKVYQDGKLIKTMPITAGKSGWETRNGTKVILEKHREITMDGESVGINPGDPEYYLLDVEYALRVTWSGEFVHAAPWSEGSQGIDNVSHGCVGLSTADARWFFGITTRGDVLTVRNSSRPLERGNGYTDWNEDWADWVAGGALSGSHPPDGSGSPPATVTIPATTATPTTTTPTG